MFGPRNKCESKGMAQMCAQHWLFIYNILRGWCKEMEGQKEWTEGPRLKQTIRRIGGHQMKKLLQDTCYLFTNWGLQYLNLGFRSEAASETSKC